MMRNLGGEVSPYGQARYTVSAYPLCGALPRNAPAGGYHPPPPPACCLQGSGGTVIGGGSLPWALRKRGAMLGLMLLALYCPRLGAQAKPLEEQRLDTIQYGTETEITVLIGNLKSEGADYLDQELTVLVNDTRNRNILSGVFSFFGERSKGGLEERARRAILERDDEANETIQASVEYLGKLKDPQAVSPIQELLDGEERRFMNAAFRALGRIAGGNSSMASDIAAYLIDYYVNREPGDENRREIVIAVGEAGSQDGVGFLKNLVDNSDERAVIRMAALESLSKIGDPRGLQAILDSISSQDPNVRSTAVAALGPFEGSEVDHAILEAFRDSYWRTRISAAQAARTRKLAVAIPYLAYRAEWDETPNVKDEAIRALGAIGSGEAQKVLDTLFTERKNSARVRILASEMLVELNGDAYAERLIAEMDEAKRTNQTALYNGFLKALGAAKTGKLESLAARFLDSGGVVEKSYALDIMVNNSFRGLIGRAQTLAADEKNGNLARKARTSLEKMGVSPASP